MTKRALLAGLVLGVVACGGTTTESTALPAATTTVPSDTSTPGDETAPSSTSTAPGTTPPVTPGPDTVTIVTEPSDKAQALLSAIQNAKTSIHMTMYLLDDKRFVTALLAQKKAGLDVKVVLNEKFPAGAGSNATTFSQLEAGGVTVAWAPAGFTLTHEKCVLIDGAQAWIMTMNLEASSSSNRELLAIDTQAPDVKEAEAIFEADLAGTQVIPVGDLVVSPDNSRSKLVALIGTAKTSVDVEGEELSDTAIVNALVAAKTSGLAVRVVLAANAPTPAQSTAVDTLKAAHVACVKVSTPYIHAKTIVVDAQRAYVGSENFTAASLSYNRELGVILSNATAAASIAATIGKDFGAGTAL